jgi:hypothetical protein
MEESICAGEFNEADAMIWLDGGERVIRDFDFCQGCGLEESGFSNIWFSHNAD